MDQEPLVEEQKDAGEKVVTLLRDNGFDVAAAFWLKEDEDSSWFLYVASKNVESAGIREAYRNALDIIRRRPESSVDFLTLKLIRPSDPLAKAVLDFQASRPPTRTKAWVRGRPLGGVYINAAYIYPHPQPTAVP
jgi:hypothetical protein